MMLIPHTTSTVSWRRRYDSHPIRSTDSSQINKRKPTKHNPHRAVTLLPRHETPKSCIDNSQGPVESQEDIPHKKPTEHTHSLEFEHPVLGRQFISVFE